MALRGVPVVLPDLPRDTIAGHAPFQQAQLLDQILDLVRRHTALPRPHRRLRAQVIALLGRFGQGKSSIVMALCRTLRK
jgi:hypothetical protein